MPSISFRRANSKTNIKHNNRERMPPNADSKRTQDNIKFCSKDISLAYEETFGSAIEKYNERQKRNDRKINNYYRKTLHDKKTAEQQELIVQVGENKEVSIDVCKEILEEYMKDFKKRNSHMALYNAVLHMDEATPHLHINFVPFADYDKGLARRVNFEKALRQQGNPDFADWREKETAVIEKLMNERGYERTYVGTHEKYFSVTEYKKELSEVDKIKQSTINQFKAIADDLDLSNIELPFKPKKTITGHFSLSESDLKQIENINKYNEVLKAENKLLKENSEYQEKKIKKYEEIDRNSYWRKKYNRLKQTAKNLKDINLELRKKLFPLRKAKKIIDSNETLSKIYQNELKNSQKNPIEQYMDTVKTSKSKNEKSEEIDR